MSREYPDWISPGRAAEGKRVYSGTIAISRLKRLSALLEDDHGEASFVAAFRSDIDKQVVVDLQVKASLPLICQASLEAYNEHVTRRSELGVIDHEHQAKDLPDIYDPVLTEKGRLAIASLVEDELILGLPQIPRNPGLSKVEYSTGGTPRKSAEPKKRAKKNPFDALQGMLKRDQ